MERVMFISFEEAQKLIPALEYTKKVAPIKEARDSARRLLKELRKVRQIDYSPLKGYQMFLREKDYEFLTDLLGVMGSRI